MQLYTLTHADTHTSTQHMHTQVHLHLHTCAHTYTYIRTNTHAHTRVHPQAHTHRYTCTHKHTHTHTHTYTHTPALSCMVSDPILSLLLYNKGSRGADSCLPCPGKLLILSPWKEDSQYLSNEKYFCCMKPQILIGRKQSPYYKFLPHI
jgi:hypothetical protein